MAPPKVAPKESLVYGPVRPPLIIHHLNVGQGDATLIQGPGGGPVILIDAGRPGSGDRVILPYLAARGIERIDTVIITHGDADHIGGFVTGKQFPAALAPKTIVHNGLAGAGPLRPSQTLVKLRQWVETSGARVVALTDAASLEAARRVPLALGYGARLTFVAANGYVAGVAGRVRDVNTTNERSLAVYLEYGGFDYLLTGDLIGRKFGAEDAPVELLLGESLRERADSPPHDPVDVLRVGHHGANNASDLSFLLAIRPEHAIISVGNRNRYGHPHADTLARLDSAGVERIYLTNEGRTVGELDNSLRARLTVMHDSLILYTDGQSYALCPATLEKCTTHEVDTPTDR